MNTAHFTYIQIAAFRTLVDLWGTDSVALIGASALGCYIDMRWRKTNDLDLSLSVSIVWFQLQGAWRGPGSVRVYADGDQRRSVKCDKCGAIAPPGP